MSRHRPPDVIHMPPETKSASHVYVKFEKQNNLGQKLIGPFPIIDRPTNTTLTIRVGYDAQGHPRDETHHWDRVQVAHLCPDVTDFERVRLGRKRFYTNNVNKEEIGAKLPTTFGKQQEIKTQPRTAGDRYQYQETPAALAEVGLNLPLPHPPTTQLTRLTSHGAASSAAVSTTKTKPKLVVASDF